MKKIIIVNNNMKVGGVQKSLCNLLWEIDGQYDVTLCLFREIGAYMDCLPPSVKVVEACGVFRYFGIAQSECRGIDNLKRGILVILSRMLGREKILSNVKCHQPVLESSYDVAISYLHNGRARSFYGGVQDYVLNCVNANKKIAFLHGDYRNCGSNNEQNNRQLEKFDRIAACSEGCRRALLSVMPHLQEQSVTVQNFHRYDEICAMAQADAVMYDEKVDTHILMVSRLSHEKGIDRAIRAVAYAKARGLRVHLHLVGDGGERERLEGVSEELDVLDWILFHGEQSNPYRYMKSADLLLMTSYHEAAPMVVDEARALGLPVLTTETTSSYDMVIERQCGWVCENDQEALNRMLFTVLKDRELLHRKKKELQGCKIDNSYAMEQFSRLMRGA